MSRHKRAVANCSIYYCQRHGLFTVNSFTPADTHRCTTRMRGARWILVYRDAWFISSCAACAWHCYTCTIRKSVNRTAFVQVIVHSFLVKVLPPERQLLSLNEHLAYASRQLCNKSHRTHDDPATVTVVHGAHRRGPLQEEELACLENAKWISMLLCRNKLSCSRLAIFY